MTVLKPKTFTVACDGPECFEGVKFLNGTSDSIARQILQSAGWGYVMESGDAVDLCPSHLEEWKKEEK